MDRQIRFPKLLCVSRSCVLSSLHLEYNQSYLPINPTHLFMLLHQMEVDVMDVDAEARVAAKKRLVSYKTQLSDAQAKLKRGAVAMSSGQAARDELFADAGASEDSVGREGAVNSRGERVGSEATERRQRRKNKSRALLTQKKAERVCSVRVHMS